MSPTPENDENDDSATKHYIAGILHGTLVVGNSKLGLQQVRNARNDAHLEFTCLRSHGEDEGIVRVDVDRPGVQSRA